MRESFPHSRTPHTSQLPLSELLLRRPQIRERAPRRSARKLKDTIKKRANFLKLCPASSQSPEMASLVNSMANGAGRCDSQSLNSSLIMYRGWDSGETYISNRMPDYCAAYTGHAYTDFNSSGTMPRYVGTPEEGGYWVEAKDYDRALAEYNARLEEQRRRNRENGWLQR